MNQEFWQLRAASQNYFDAHQTTTRLTNRRKALARRGLVEPILDQQLAIAEEGRKRIGKELEHLYKAIAPEAIVKFQQATTGLGELYVAQLIGCVGDFKTYTEAWWEEPEDGSPAADDSQRTSDDGEDEQPREKRVLVTGATVSCGVRDIWSYCGHGDANRKRRKGMTQQEAFQLGSPLAKTITHMIADFSVRFNGQPDKNGKARPMSPYYPYFAKAKEEAQAKHEKWTKGHCQNHAVRLVGKAILKDIWRIQHGQDPVYGAQTPWTPRVVQPVAV